MNRCPSSPFCPLPITLPYLHMYYSVLLWMASSSPLPSKSSFVLAQLLPSLKTFNRTQLEDLVSSNLITLSLWWKIECIDHWLNQFAGIMQYGSVAVSSVPSDWKGPLFNSRMGQGLSVRSFPCSPCFCVRRSSISVTTFLWCWRPFLLTTINITQSLLSWWTYTVDVHKSLCYVTLKGC